MARLPLSAASWLLLTVSTFFVGIARAQDLPVATPPAIPYNKTANISYISLNDASGKQTVELVPGAKWAWCGIPTKENVAFKLNATGKLFTGVITPAGAKSCDPSKPSKCAVFDSQSCDQKPTCSLTSFAEISQRPKCIMVINSNGTGPITFLLQVTTYSPGNWAAINFGVAIVTVALATVIGIGCYYDVKTSKRQHGAAPKPPPADQDASLRHEQ